MVRVGHALLGTRGEVLSTDEGFCEILETDAEALIGRSVLDVTVPADRLTCQTLMQHLQATREPFRVTKRYIKADGRPVWVTNTVSIIALGDAAPMLVSTIVPISPPTGGMNPAHLLDCAKLLLSSRQERRTAFDTAIFADPAWDMMLAAYVAEAEGMVLDLDTLARAANVPHGSAARWVRAMQHDRLIEVEAQGRDTPTSLFRLTATAHGQFEDYLAGIILKGAVETGPS